MNLKQVVLFLSVSLCLNACAFDIVHIQQQPANIELQQNRNADFLLAEECRVSLGTGYRRSLRANTNWIFVGALPQGDVFKTKDQILTVEASNIYEAYIVVEEDHLIGFYLPAEETYSPLNKPLLLNVIHQ
jgi:hypothetical protein